MPKCDFNKVALQLYWNHISAWVFSCKFAAYFQNTFLQQHLWRAACAPCFIDLCLLTLMFQQTLVMQIGSPLLRLKIKFVVHFTPTHTERLEKALKS